MTDSCDLNNANGKECIAEDMSMETESNKEVNVCMEEVLNKSVEMNADGINNVDTDILNKTVQEIDKDSIQENEEFQGPNSCKRFSKIIDSDSEDENIFTSQMKRERNVTKSSEDKEYSNKKRNKKKIFDSDTDEEVLNVNNNHNAEGISNKEKEGNAVQNRFQSLVDSESEEEDERTPMKYEESKQHKEHSKFTKRKVSSRASKDEAMKQIHSETQRLIRETEISLPYHRPKQRTLQESLSRKKVLSALPKASTMAAKLKMSSAIVDKVLKEKEEETEVFYKSSDSEEEAIESHSETDKESPSEADKESPSEGDKESENIQCTQKVRKDIIPKKLFVSDSLSVDNNKEESSAYVVHEANEIATETNETESNELTAISTMLIDDLSDLVTLETHCNTTDTENGSQHRTSETEKIVDAPRNKEEDNLLQSGHIENGDRDKNTVKSTFDERCDDEENNSKFTNDFSEASTSKTNNDFSEASTSKTNNDFLEASTSKINNDFSEASTSKTNNDYATMVKRSLGIPIEESDEYDEYGLPPPKFDNSPNMNEKKTSLNVQSLKPKLKGAPGTMIDLSDDVKPNKRGVDALIDRFLFKHSKKDEKVKDISEVTVTHIKESPNGLPIVVKETLPYKLPTFGKEDPALQKPGAKLLRLKEELKHRIAMKHEVEWKEKEQEMKEHEIDWTETLDDEEEFSKSYSPSIETNETEEDEPVEDDVYEQRKKKTKSKCAFVDDEAEVSGDDEDNDEIIDEDEDENSEKEDEECERLILEDDESSTCSSANMNRKSFKRIVEPIEDDSRSCDTVKSDDTVMKDRKVSRTMISLDMFNGSASDNESDIPVSQMHVENDLEGEETSRTPRIKANSFNFVSPATQLTALSTGLEDEKKSAQVEQVSLVNESDPILMESPLIDGFSQRFRGSKNEALPHRKLPFTDQNDMTEDDLMGLCSGTFLTNKNNLYASKEPDVSESQLLELCSGTFSSQANNSEVLTNYLSSEKSQDVSTGRGSTSIEKDDCQENERSKGNDVSQKKSSVRYFEEDEQDEDLMEQPIKIRPMKRKVKKLDLSDDEEENERSMLSDDDEQSEDDEDEQNEDDEDKFIDYDSEENEVVVPKKSIKQYAATFLENEAELSESDCDVSADEDEKDMDDLELEEGDDEEIDEIKMKNQLGKLHMKQILDKDQKEVKILKELLFEEGDMFSDSARERKFKWKNIDKQDGNDQFEPSEDKDGWVDLSDDEDEAKWRKIRHEREKFLAEKMSKENVESEIENELQDSQIFQLGMKILKKRRVDENQTENTLVDSVDSKVKSRLPITVAEMLNCSNLQGKSRLIHNVMQKRSFLARGEETLTRLAVLARQKDVPAQLKNPKNFVFAHIDPSAENKSADPVLQTEHQRYKGKRKY